jgi:glucose-6-phosphate 1-dehydrogenase
LFNARRGDQQHFVRRDELRAAWSIFTPLLHGIDRGEISPQRYPYGSRGPADQDGFLADSGYLRSVRYIWRPSKSTDSMGSAEAGTTAAPAKSPAKPNL